MYPFMLYPLSIFIYFLILIWSLLMVQSLEESSEGLDSLCKKGKKRSSITELSNQFLVEYFFLLCHSRLLHNCAKKYSWTCFLINLETCIWSNLFCTLSSRLLKYIKKPKVQNNLQAKKHTRQKMWYFIFNLLKS